MLAAAKEWFLEIKDTLKELMDSQEQEDCELSSLDLDDHHYPSVTQRLLPYHYFDDASQVFFNKYNAGVLYRIIPLTGGNEQIAEQLDAILQAKISHEFTMHMILVKHNQVGNDIDAYARQFESTEFNNLSILGEHLKEFYIHAAINGFANNTTSKPRLTHTECYIVIDKVNRESERVLNACFGQFCVSFEASLSAAKIGFKRGDAPDLLHLINYYLAHAPESITPRPVTYDPSTLLKEQALSHDFDIQIHNDSMVIKGVTHEQRAFETGVSVLTIDKLPSEFHLWDNINNTSNIFNPDKSIPCNHIISVTYRLEEQGRAQARANRKTRDLVKKSKTDYAINVAGTDKQAHAWQKFREDLVADKTRSTKMLYNVILFSRPGEKERDVEAARIAFSYNGIKLAQCMRMQWPYFLACMPFLFTGNLEHSFSLPTMMWPISSWNAVQYMPLLSDWTGVGRGMLLPTMRDQFACIDPFSGAFGTNFNIAVTGTSGGGKSFFIQMLMLNVLFNGGDIFIIDVGGSYRKLCETLGGTYLEYSNLALNPFTHVTDIFRELDEVISLFELLTCPTRGASDDDRGTLREAILLAFNKTGKDTRIDEVASELTALYEDAPHTYPSGRILSKNLQRYCAAAEHGKVFNEPSKLSPHARIIVVDLKEIEDNQSIRAPVLLSVISQFQRRMFNSDRNKQKMCIIDEAWSFFTGDPIASNYITKGFRTGRRHKASFVTVTQGIEDYFEFIEARAAWENSALKLIFLQEHSALTEHQKKHDTFTAYEETLLKSFPKAKDAGFSQVLLRANGISSVHRFFVDKFVNVLLSSDGDDYQAVQNYVTQGMDYFAAVARVAQEHFGARHASV